MTAGLVTREPNTYHHYLSKCILKKPFENAAYEAILILDSEQQPSFFNKIRLNYRDHEIFIS